MSDSPNSNGQEVDPVMVGAERSEAPEVGETKNSPEVEKQRLEHEKSMHTREDKLFNYGKETIKYLFIFSGIVIVGVILVIGLCKASPWLVTLASISILTPAVLLACLFQHVYSKNKDNSETVKQVLNHTPFLEILRTLKETIEEIIKSKS